MKIFLGFLAALLVLIPFAIMLVIKLMGKSSLSHRTDVGQGTGMDAEDSRLNALIGQRVHTETMLRPSGKVAHAGEFYEALTQGEALDKGENALVIAVKNGALLVEKAKV
jgi:membrane-bound ClpP family serine protease